MGKSREGFNIYVSGYIYITVTYLAKDQLPDQRNVKLPTYGINMGI